MDIVENHLLDELGSPLRVSGYGAGKETADIRNEYLTYGYDEFGNDLYKELEEAGIPCPYDRQGEDQSFGYTGYRFDVVSGTYFAQAREYRAESGRFTAEEVHWNAYNNIYGDNPRNYYVPNTNAVRQSSNLYVYCMNNSIRYVDAHGAEAGDPFKSLDDAAEDFANIINGQSIEENVEYGTYIYSWQETKTYFFFINISKTYYSYTKPFTNNMKGHAIFEPYKPPIPEGTIWEAAVHTHGAYMKIKNENWKKFETLNDKFSQDDMKYAIQASIPLYLVSSNGSLQVYDPTKELLFRTSVIVEKWKLPHDKNHPDLPSNHKKDCKDCFEEKSD